jgi:predicted Zn-dependent protease
VRRVPAGLTLALAAAGAACSDGVGTHACFDSGVQPYAYHAPGDTSVVFRWPAAFHPVRVYAEPTRLLPGDVDTAMRVWVNAFRCGELSLLRVTDSAAADIVVRAPAALPPFGPASVTVAADSVTACRGRTDVELDTAGRVLRPIRSYIAPASLDSASVAACQRFVSAHELGHALGLFSHSSDPADLMYAQPWRRLLTARDRYTIQLLYHRDPTVAPEPR